MPTSIPSGEKTCALGIIKSTACDYYNEFNTHLVNIEDIPKCIFGYLSIFICNPTLLANFLGCFVTAGELESVGIYLNKTDVDTITDPVVIVNCVLTTLAINNSEDPGSVLIAGTTTTINKVNITKNVGNLNILHASHIRLLSVDSGHVVSNLNLTGCLPQWHPMVEYITTGSPITVINNQNGILGENTCKNTTTLCTDEVSALASANLTVNSLELTWTNPAGSIANIVQYRKSGTNEYFFIGSKDDGVTGNKVTSASIPTFYVTGLQPATFYDFIVYNICANGLKSAGTKITIITNGSF